VTPQTPPTFLLHTNEDTAVPAENSVYFYLALRKAKVPAELHIYEKGQHGVGLGAAAGAVGTWPRRCEEWMRGRGLLEKAQR
jgi:dipeptidyl aminopeptidase/acylaminoacyl peptidase